MLGPQVIPALAGDATDQTPPDLPSYLFKERIVYLVSGTLGWGTRRMEASGVEACSGAGLRRRGGPRLWVWGRL